MLTTNPLAMITSDPKDVPATFTAADPPTKVTEILSYRCAAHMNRKIIHNLLPFMRRRTSKLQQQREQYPPSHFYCEVGMKSLFRTVSKFYKEKLWGMTDQI